ncbi:hypothetical protein KY339_03100 [Candidatus Woesearchaeota archaeon]|nr:hypothetical protein [Candidatus Woesearchaeota archaeon]
MVNVRTLTELNEMLSNSFSAIRRDMEGIRRFQKEQLKNQQELGKEIKNLELTFVKKEDFKESLKRIEEVSLGRIKKELEETRKRNDDLVKLLNTRINDINVQFKKNIEIKDEISQIKKDLLSKFKDVDDLFNVVRQLDRELVNLDKRSTEKKEFNAFVKDTNKRIVKIKDENMTKEQAENLVMDVNKEFDLIKEKVDNFVSVEKLEKELEKLRESVSKLNNNKIPIKSLLERHTKKKKKKVPKKPKAKKKVSKTSKKKSFY